MRSPFLFTTLVVLIFFNFSSVGREALPFGHRVLDPIISSGITVELELFAEMPHTAEELPYTRINYMASLRDGSGRLYVSDLRGKIYEISSGKPLLYMDYIREVPELFHTKGFGTGLCSVAFHPDFAENGKFYTVHTEKVDVSDIPEDVPEFQKAWWRTGVVMEWTADDPTASEFKGERRELLRVYLPSHAHGFQEIAFNPNAKVGESDYGMLYICLGESGALQMKRTQYLRTLSAPYGCILRIDPSGSGSHLGDYGIPPDNPWAGTDDPNVLGEIWAMGMRNPHRIHWDRGGTGRMFFVDIGESRIEELNIAEGGRDYGWPVREGRYAFDPNGERYEIFELIEDDEKAYPGLTYPVAQYEHLDGVAISGGGVYRGEAIPALWGKYIMGDIAFGRFFFVTESDLNFDSSAPVYEFQVSVDGVVQSMMELVGGGRVDLRFGWDAEGELYVFEKGHGRIYKAVGATMSAGNLVKEDYSSWTLNKHDIEANPELAVVATEEGALLDDFEDGDLRGLVIDGRNGRWLGYGESSGGVQEIAVVEDDDAPGTGKHVLRVEDKRGEAGRDPGLIVPLVADVEPVNLLHVDASVFDGLQFWVRASGVDRVNVVAGTPYVVPVEDGGLCNGKDYHCYRMYTHKVSVSEEWTLVQVPFEALKQVKIPNDGPFDSALLKVMGVSFPSKSKYDVWFDDVSFYKD